MLIAIALATFVATLLGGLLALRLKDKLHLILGFSAGAIVGVAFFDLLPEAFELATGRYEPGVVAAVIALGFVAYLIVDRFVIMHGHDDECAHDERKSIFGAGSLSAHSFLDGVAIGLAFQVSPAVGAVVAAAVLAHDFSDGINTVSMVLKNGGERKTALRWLVVDALAPVLGIVATMFVSVSEPVLGMCLALFAGFFIYIGASDLIPESHHAHPHMWTTVATILGMGVMYLIITLAGV